MVGVSVDRLRSEQLSDKKSEYLGVCRHERGDSLCAEMQLENGRKQETGGKRRQQRKV